MWISPHRSSFFGLSGFVFMLLHTSTGAAIIDGDLTVTTFESQESFQPSHEFPDPIQPLIPEFPDSMPSFHEVLLLSSESKYSTLVVFGDSYSDNGHPRAPEYQRSFAPKPAVGGRFSDGPVWDEYLAQELSSPEDTNITFLNYAYNGAHINNKLSNFTSNLVPDTAEQIQMYLTELAEYSKHPISQNVLDARILHTIWIGINPIMSIWTSAVNQTHHSDTFLTTELVRKLDAQVAEVGKQLTLLLENPSLSKLQSDYLIMTIPPLTYTQAVLAFSSEKAKGNATLAGKYIQLLSQITGYYNTKLVEVTHNSYRRHEIAQDVQNPENTPFEESRVIVFDTATFWNEVRSEPQKFGIDSFGCCYDNTKKPRCQPPSHFMYWDILHPSTRLHAGLSTAIKKFLGGFDGFDD